MWLRTTANKRTAPRTRRPRTPRTSEGVVLTQSSPEGAVARVSTGRVGTRRTGPDRLQAVDLLAAQERGDLAPMRVDLGKWPPGVVARHRRVPRAPLWAAASRGRELAARCRL